MNPLLIFGLGAVAGVGLSAYGRPLLVRLFRIGMVTTDYVKSAGSYAADKVQGASKRVAPTPPAAERRPKKSTARRGTKTAGRTPAKKPGARTGKTPSRGRATKKETTGPTPETTS
jgi:hypothetical protein